MRAVCWLMVCALAWPALLAWVLGPEALGDWLLLVAAVVAQAGILAGGIRLGLLLLVDRGGR